MAKGIDQFKINRHILLYIIIVNMHTGMITKTDANWRKPVMFMINKQLKITKFTPMSTDAVTPDVTQLPTPPQKAPP